MTNQNYAQVMDLLATGTLHWDTDSIIALLVTGASFDATNKRFSDLGASLVTRAPIQGRWIAEGGLAMGLPAAFSMVAPGTPFQVVVAQDNGSADPVLLSYLDENADGDPIEVQRGGTLVVRPSQENLPTPPDTMTPPPTTGLWMTF
jgi:hypothetical protein